jgi:hypothetical protein
MRETFDVCRATTEQLNNPQSDEGDDADPDSLEDCPDVPPTAVAHALVIQDVTKLAGVALVLAT